MSGEKLNKDGLMRLWHNFAALIKVFVGDVDVKNKGDLQTQVDGLDKKLKECFQSASDGKELVANAVTGKGVLTLATDTFATIAANIAKIKTVATLQSKSAVLNTSTTSVTMKPDSGYDGLSQATVSITLQEKTAALSTAAQNITPDSGKLLSKVTVPAISGTAVAGDVLTGKTFSSGAAGVGKTGTMANKGAWTGATTGSGNVAIPAGYHNGSGYVSGAGAYNKGVSDADARVNANSANYKAGYNAGVSAADGRTNADSANYKSGYNAGVSATKKGTAAAGDVLTGKTFTNESSVGASGSMANRGGTTVDAGTVTQDNDYTYFAVPANGYYNTNSKLRAQSRNVFGDLCPKLYRTSIKIAKGDGNSITIGTGAIRRILYLHMDSRRCAVTSTSPTLSCKLNDDGTVTISAKCTSTNSNYTIYIYLLALESSNPVHSGGTVCTKTASGSMTKNTTNPFNFTDENNKEIKSVTEFTAAMSNGQTKSANPELEVWLEGSTIYSTLYETSDGTPGYNITVKYTV